MKKLINVLVLCGTVSLLAAQETKEFHAIVREINGAVEVKASGQRDWVPAAIGQKLERETLLSTGFGSTAVLALGNSTLIVQALTRLSLEEIIAIQGNEQTRLFLHTGRIRAEITPPSGGKTDFTIRSPTAVASVRGTAFNFNGMRLRVDDGRVHLTGGDTSGVYVGRGRSVLANAETGRIATVRETVRGTLFPSPPAGVNTTDNQMTTQFIPPPSPPETGHIDGGFDWK
jgi:hypothetical protein